MERTFHMLLYRVSHAQRNYLRPYVGEIGLGTGQPKLVAYLAEHGSCRQRELADYFEIDPAAVSRMLDNMGKAGFVTCRADEHNRRSDVVELTDKGREAYENWRTHCRDMEEIMLQGFFKGRTNGFCTVPWPCLPEFKTQQGGRRADNE